MPNPVRDYLRTIRQNLNAGIATERSHYPALGQLLEELASQVKTVNEPKRIACGAPDFAVLRDGLMVGHIEAKDVDVPLGEIERSEQLLRYRRSLENLILTNFIEFRWYVDGDLRRSVELARLDAHGSLQTVRDGAEEVADLLGDFLNFSPAPITTPQALAERMARLTHLIREIIVTAFEKDEASDRLKDWREAFAEVLVEGLDEPENVGQFADMFAQTLAYGLFSARLLHDYGSFSRQRAQELIPETNPFLREFFYDITGVHLTGEPYAGLVEDLVQVLDHADMEAILADFGRRTRQDDPTVHFYETFLAVYDPKLRERRGVFYTPNPVVSFIVRSVDKLLKSKFGLIDGLADTTKLPDGTHRVLVLDPACGTATFLYHIIDLIRARFMAQNNAGMWSGYVKEHLLKRIFGFELLMAPYAVAHFKLALQLSGYDLPSRQQEQWAYDFGSDERLQIYLTNALEVMTEEPPRLIGSTKIVAEEAQAADEVKREKPIMVIVGNPPYSVSSSNKGEYIEALMDRYKEAVRDERNIQPLSDDYIKFIRFAHDRVERTGSGVIGMITNHSYLAGLIHRGMREELIKTFDEIFILNLHGNALIGETAPDGGIDENVFDIRQGVAIVLLVKVGNEDKTTEVRYADLWGKRDEKYQVLNDTNVAVLTWELLNPVAPHYFFVPKDFGLQEEYDAARSVEGIFPLHSTGFTTHRDDFAIGFSQEELEARVADLIKVKFSDSEIRSLYDLDDTRDWSLSEARKSLRKDNSWKDHFEDCLYRPFDVRRIYFNGSVVEYTRESVMRHLLQDNVALLTARQLAGDHFRHVLSVSQPGDGNAISISSRERSYYFPLYLYPKENAATLFDTTTVGWQHDPNCSDRVPNLSHDFISDVKRNLGSSFDAKKDSVGFAGTFGPDDIFCYIYAVLYSPTYRKRYAEFLKIDFPRVPITSDVDLFWQLVALGDELIQFHLMEHPDLANTITSYPVAGSNRVKRRGGFPKFIPKGESRTKTSDVAEQNRVYINLEQYFAGVPEEVWDFEVGGYQVLHKWLKDRKGRVLSYDELNHYQRIVVALKETIRLMEEIDEAIPSWPIE